MFCEKRSPLDFVLLVKMYCHHYEQYSGTSMHIVVAQVLANVVYMDIYFKPWPKDFGPRAWRMSRTRLPVRALRSLSA